MKYIIDVEKIEGTNLWKAKEFNTLVFDKNGLDRMTILDKDKQQIEIDILNRELDDKAFRVGQLQNLVNGKSRKINEMHSFIKKLEKENEELKKRQEENVPIEEVVNADKEMNNSDMFEKVFGYYATEMWAKPHDAFVDWINAKYTPIEEVVDKKYYNKKIGSLNDTYYDDALFIDEPTLRLIEKLNHTIKCQKGMLKKQGKELKELRLEDMRNKARINHWRDAYYIKLKQYNSCIWFGKDN